MIKFKLYSEDKTTEIVIEELEQSKENYSKISPTIWKILKSLKKQGESVYETFYRSWLQDGKIYVDYGSYTYYLVVEANGKICQKTSVDGKITYDIEKVL